MAGRNIWALARLLVVTGVLFAASACGADCPAGTQEARGLCVRRNSSESAGSSGETTEASQRSGSSGEGGTDAGKSASSRPMAGDGGGASGSQTGGRSGDGAGAGASSSQPSDRGGAGATSERAQGGAGSSAAPQPSGGAGAGGAGDAGSKSPQPEPMGGRMSMPEPMGGNMSMPPACTPRTEQCNGDDDDCDSKVDEGEAAMRSCGSDVGACRLGVQRCVSGAWSAECSGGVSPTTEACDGADQDCDGRTDETASCTGGKTCVEGACVECTGDAACARLSAACHVGYCDAGTCKTRDLEGMRCSASGVTGVCSNDKCVECTGTAQCASKATTPVCNTATNKCVECLVTNDCKEKMTRCVSNRCESTCGNGQFDPGEQCDLPQQDAYHCDPATCLTRSLYLPCTPTPGGQCMNGADTGYCGYGYCSPMCAGASDCPKARSSDKPACSGGICLLTCTTASDCPATFECSGMICIHR